MTLKTKIVVACAAAAMVITMGAANAQTTGSMQPGAPMGAYPPSGSMMQPGGSMMPSGSSMMPSGGSMTTSQVTQSTTTAGDPYAMESTDTLPNTGGEPLLMMMAGTLMAGSAFAMRRKLS